MAFLLLLHEKLRLRRQVNKLTLKQAQNFSRLERVQKNIERIQKMYSKQETTLDQQAKNWSALAKNSIWSGAGLNSNQMGFNPLNFGMGNGNSLFRMNAMQQAIANNSKLRSKIGEGNFEKMMAEYQAGTLSKTNDGADVAATDRKYGANGEFNYDQIQAFQQLMTWAGNCESQAQMQCQNTITQYDTGLTNYVARMKEQIEDEQAMALAPLEALQTEYDLEKSSIETQLASARERLQTIEQACSEEVKNSAPKFGLG